MRQVAIDDVVDVRVLVQGKLCFRRARVVKIMDTAWVGIAFQNPTPWEREIIGDRGYYPFPLCDIRPVSALEQLAGVM